MNKNGEKTKLLAVIAVFAMVACALVAFAPTADAADSVAVPSNATQVDSADDILATGGTYVLTKDISVTGAITVTGAFALYLNGFDITSTSTTDGTVFDFSAGENDAVASAIYGAGTITSTVENSNATIDIRENVTLTLDAGVAIKSSGYGVAAWNSGKLVVENADISASSSAISGNGTQTGTEITINGGTFTSSNAAAVYFPSTQKLDINGGTFTGKMGIEIRAGTVTIDGATINANGALTNNKTETDGPLDYGMAVAVIDKSGYATGSEISVTVGNDVVLNGSSYDAYVGDINGTTGTTGTFDTKAVGESYTYTHKITFDMPGYEFSSTASTAGYRFAAIDVSATSFTVPAGYVFDGTVSYDETNSVAVEDAKAGVGGITFAKGSVVISGTIDATQAVTITADGEVKINDVTVTGTEGGLTVAVTEDGADTVTVVGTLNVAGKLTVGENSTLAVAEGADVTVTGTLAVSTSSTIINGGNIDASNGTFELGSATLVASPTSTTAGVKVTTASTVKYYEGASITATADSQNVPEKPNATTYDASSFTDLVTAVNAGMDKIVINASAAGGITISSDITIPVGTTVYDVEPTTLGDGENTLFVAAGETLVVEGDMILTKTAVVVNGTLIVEGTLETTNLTVSATGMVENSGIIDISGALTVDKNTKDEVNFENSGDMYIGDKSTVDGKFDNSGAVGISDAQGVIASNVKIEGDGTFNNLSGGVVGFPVNTKVVTGVTYDVTMTTDITQSTQFGSLQNVIVPEGAVLTVQRTATLTINGTLTVLGTLNVEGQLVIASNAGAKIVIDGTVNVNTNGNNQGAIVIGKLDSTVGSEVDEPGYATVNGTLTVGDGSLVDIVNGAVTVNGTMSMLAGSTLDAQIKATAEIDDVYNDTKTTVSGLVVAENGTLQLAGDLAAGTNNVSVYGNVTVANGSSAVKTQGSLDIAIAGRNAVVTVESFDLTGANKLTVSDEGLILREGNRTNAYVIAGQGDYTNVNKFEFGSGDISTALNGTLTFTETVTSKVDGTKTVYSYDMFVAGAVSATLDTSGFTPSQKVEAKNCATMSVYGTDVNVAGDLAVGAYVVMTNNGKLTVDGTVTNTAAGAQAIVNARNAEIQVNGLITASAKISNSGIVNAAYYVITSGSPSVTTYNYSTLEAAVPAVADAANTATKNIEILGTVTVKENLDVPAGITITVNKDAKLYVGPEKDGQDVVMTMQAGSKMTSYSNGVEVRGTLTFNDKTNDATTKTVSDVTVEDANKNGYRTYTNIYTALAEATDGQTVTVTKEESAGYVELNQNITVPAGVTLVVPNRAASLLLADGVTLTVDGTLQTSSDIYAETAFGTKAMNVSGNTAQQTSAIVVNGALMAETAFKYDNSQPVTAEDEYDAMSAGAPIYGSYYQTDDWYVVSSMAVAQQSYADIVTSSIEVYGPVTAGDLVFTQGTSDVCGQIVVKNKAVSAPDAKDGETINSSLTVGSLTVSGFDVVVESGAKITGTVAAASSSVEFAGISGSTTALTVSENDGSVVLTGTAVQGKDASLEVATGTVIAGTTGATGVPFAFTTSEKTGMTVAAEATLNAVNVDAIEKLTVNGTMSMASGNSATFGDLTVNGTAAIAASTDTSSAATANVSGKLVIGATANFSGPVASVGEYTMVYAGATVDAVAVDSFGDYSTEFYVEDALWATVYDEEANNTQIDKAKFNPHVENAYFDKWVDDEGEDLGDSNNKIGQESAVYASINYDVYYIVVLANQAVDDVTIDNNLMQYGLIGVFSNQAYYGYTAWVAAGNHTINYTLANGYSGNGVLTVNGVQQSGLTFTTTGTPDKVVDGTSTVGIQYNLQLSGFEKTGYVPESPDTGSSDDSGMGITDYLLIVLVVLIIVMAIIVAMRLMRS